MASFPVFSFTLERTIRLISTENQIRSCTFCCCKQCSKGGISSNVSICDEWDHVNRIWMNIRAYRMTCHWVVFFISIISIKSYLRDNCTCCCFTFCSRTCNRCKLIKSPCCKVVCTSLRMPKHSNNVSYHVTILLILLLIPLLVFLKYLIVVCIEA